MEWYFTFQWGIVFQMRGFIFKGGCPMGGSINFEWGGGGSKKVVGWGGVGCPPLWETLHSSMGRIFVINCN